MVSQIDSGPETTSTIDANWSRPTRLLHLGLVVTVTAQLGISLIMAPPDEEQASALASTAFEAREFLGMTALVIVLIHWLWTVVRQTDGGIALLHHWSGHMRYCGIYFVWVKRIRLSPGVSVTISLPGCWC